MARLHRPELTFGILALSVTTFVLLQSLVVPVLATIEREFDTDQATVTWVLTGYLLSASIATPLLGRVGDVVGKTRMLVVCLAVLAVGSLLATVAPTIGWLIAARVIQGFGGGVLPLSFGIARDEFGPRLTQSLSVLASLAAVGFGIGIVVAGPIVSVFGFRGLFWLPMVATALAAVAAAVFIPGSPVRTPARLPVWPAVLLAGWLMLLLLALSEGNERGWGSVQILTMLGGAALLLFFWVRTELRVPVPMIDMRMMRRRGVWTANAIAGCVGFATFAAFGFVPQFLQTDPSAGYGFGATISESGRMLAPSAFASFFMGFIAASLIKRWGARNVVSTGASIVALTFCSLALFHDEVWQIYLSTTLQGIGSGLVFSSLAGIVIASVTAEQTGVATGMNANIRTIGGSLGAAVMAGVVTAQLGSGGLPVESGYVIGFFVMAGAMAAAAVVARFLPDIHEANPAPATAPAAVGAEAVESPASTGRARTG